MKKKQLFLEALYIKALTQSHYMYAEHPSEPQAETLIRQSIWEELNKALNT